MRYFISFVYSSNCHLNVFDWVVINSNLPIEDPEDLKQLESDIKQQLTESNLFEKVDCNTIRVKIINFIKLEG